MFYSLGVEDCFESIYRAAKTTLFKIGKSDPAFIPMEAIKPALARLTQEHPGQDTLQAQGRNQHLKPSTGCDLEDAHSQRLEQSLSHLRAIDPTLFEIFGLVVKKIHVTDDPALAKSKVLGQVYINRKKSWTLWEDWDALVESLSHQLLLLDEIHRPHYLTRLDQDEPLKAQALRDLTFQVVGSCEVLCFREKVHRIFFPETGSSSFAKRLRACNQALNVLMPMLEAQPTTARLQEILTHVQCRLSQMQGQRVAISHHPTLRTF